jgi:hypothetical protein
LRGEFASAKPIEPAGAVEHGDAPRFGGGRGEE